jgi:uncharacterized protein YbjT (DUF2867 family)
MLKSICSVQICHIVVGCTVISAIIISVIEGCATTMILVTAGTSYLGRSVLRRLTEFGYPVRTLLHPRRQSPNLPVGVAVDVALAALSDRRGVRAALVGVDTVIHLTDHGLEVVAENQLDDHVEGTRIVAEASAEAGVKRLVFVSSIGADRASAYPALRAYAIAEEYVRQSGVPSTIVRTGVIFGEDDHFTTAFAKLLAVSPLFFPITGDGSVLMQPLWVEDLATCITWALEDPGTLGQIYEVGGPEYLTLRQVLQLIMIGASCPRILIPMRPPYLRWITRLLNGVLFKLPVNTLTLDSFAINRTTDLNALPTIFGLQPSRMDGKLSYLQERNWGWDLLMSQIRRR